MNRTILRLLGAVFLAQVGVACVRKAETASAIASSPLPPDRTIDPPDPLPEGDSERPQGEPVAEPMWSSTVLEGESGVHAVDMARGPKGRFHVAYIRTNGFPLTGIATPSGVFHSARTADGDWRKSAVDEEVGITDLTWGSTWRSDPTGRSNLRTTMPRSKARRS